MTNTLHRLDARDPVRLDPGPNDSSAKCLFITAGGTELIDQAA
jgi:DNA-binding MarR family transcriptional regulator